MQARPSSPQSPRQVVGRLAPSPTGALHVGHAWSFLLAWWSARAQGGRVVLRLDDLDSDRVSPSLVEATLRDLEWLGLDWDGPPLLQSNERASLDAALTQLALAGLAYPCVCTRRELQAAVAAPQEGDEGHPSARYPGTCRGRFRSREHARRSTTREAGLRLRTDDRRVVFQDLLHGARNEAVGPSAGDVLLARRDGVPSYQLAVVVHDAQQGVTEVVRGADLLDSTGRQRFLQELLGLPEPHYAHVPLVRDDQGKRLAKRHDALSLATLRASGLSAEALVGWVARTAGLEGPARAPASSFVQLFSWSAVRTVDVRFGNQERLALTRS